MKKSNRCYALCISSHEINTPIFRSAAPCRRVTVPTPAPQKVSRVRDGSAGALPVPRGARASPLLRRRALASPPADRRRNRRVRPSSPPARSVGARGGAVRRSGFTAIPRRRRDASVPSPGWSGSSSPRRCSTREHRHLPLLARDDRRARTQSRRLSWEATSSLSSAASCTPISWYSFSDPRILEAFSTGQPDLAALSRGFSYEWCMAVGWAHFIAMDLFVGDGLPRLAEERRLRRAQSSPHPLLRAHGRHLPRHHPSHHGSRPRRTTRRRHGRRARR